MTCCIFMFPLTSSTCVRCEWSSWRSTLSHGWQVAFMTHTQIFIFYLRSLFTMGTEKNMPVRTATGWCAKSERWEDGASYWCQDVTPFHLTEVCDGFFNVEMERRRIDFKWSGRETFSFLYLESVLIVFDDPVCRYASIQIKSKSNKSALFLVLLVCLCGRSPDWMSAGPWTRCEYLWPRHIVHRWMTLDQLAPPISTCRQQQIKRSTESELSRNLTLSAGLEH